jgi:hypothetical protein
MPDDISDDSLAFMLEGEERLLAWDRAEHADPEIRDAARAVLIEEFILAGAKLAERVLAAADAGDVTLSDEGRAACLESIELAVNRPDWYQPGNASAP